MRSSPYFLWIPNLASQNYFNPETYPWVKTRPFIRTMHLKGYNVGWNYVSDFSVVLENELKEVMEPVMTFWLWFSYLRVSILMSA